jgi:RecB family endonuclease NucS
MIDNRDETINFLALENERRRAEVDALVRMIEKLERRRDDKGRFIHD